MHSFLSKGEFKYVSVIDTSYPLRTDGPILNVEKPHGYFKSFKCIESLFYFDQIIELQTYETCVDWSRDKTMKYKYVYFIRDLKG